MYPQPAQPNRRSADFPVATAPSATPAPALGSAAGSNRDLERGEGRFTLVGGVVPRLAHVGRTRFTVRRTLALLTYGVLWSGLRGLMSIAHRLDDVLFPRWRTARVERPVFIFANPRSGTTMLHRLLSFDTERWTTVKLYQTLFGAVVWHKLFRAVGAFDRRFCLGLIRKSTVGLGNWLFFKSRWEDIHKMGFDEPEEDECTFVYTMHTPTTMLLSPFPEELREFAWLDELPRPQREAMMDCYDGMLRRLMHVEGEGKHGKRRFLNKNVFFTPRIKTMHDRFPDATFVYLVRHPYQGLGSFLSMFYAAWKTHSPDIDKNSPEAKALARFGMDYLRYALELQAELPEDRFVVIKYDDLVADPRGTVESLYAKLGEPVSEEFAARLAEATSQQRTHKSNHAYSLEEYGLTEQEVYAELKDVFEAYGFEK